MRILSILAILLLSGCMVFNPKGTIDVAKSRRQAENACTFLFLTAAPVAGTTIGAWACSFGIDAMYPDIEEEPKSPIKKLKKKPKKEIIEEEEDEE